MVCQELRRRRCSAVAGLDLEVERASGSACSVPTARAKPQPVEIFEGLRIPDAGDVEVLGDRWRGENLTLRARLGIQLQETKFPEKLTVAEVVTLFRSFYPRGLAVGQVLTLVGLVDKGGAQVRTLSGGQKQRLSLGCALVGDPELLFLDEPTTGLDPQSRRQTWDIVESLKARGRTVLLTTHYMEEAARLCDRVAVVDHGKVIALGTPRELIASLGAEHVVEFTGATIRRATHAAVLAALPSVEKVVDERAPGAPRCRGASDRARVADDAVGAGAGAHVARDPPRHAEAYSGPDWTRLRDGLSMHTPTGHAAR